MHIPLLITLAASASAAALPSHFERVFGRQAPATAPPPGSIANDLVMGACRPATLIFTRGTAEPGNMGMFVGPPLQAQMTERLGGANNLAVQGINYNASVDGAITGFAMPNTGEGAINMANIAKATLASCPTTKIVLAGYSQGAEQVHGALVNMGADAQKITVCFRSGQ